MEMHHRYIRGSNTYQHPDVGKVQLVHIIITKDWDVKSILSEITDIPSCVSYHVEKYVMHNKFSGNNERKLTTKIFHIPEKGR